MKPTPPRSQRDRALLFVAEGFGSGRLPGGPGTWGSLVGVVWLIALLQAGNPWIWLGANLLSIPLAAALCTRAETLLGRHDPSSVVIDEIIAVPWTVLGPWVVLGHWPSAWAESPQRLVQGWWPELVAGFLAFRFFDILKPGPIGRIQRLPAGWGVVADDVTAGLAAAVVTGIVTALRGS